MPLINEYSYHLNISQNFSNMEYEENSYNLPSYTVDWSSIFIEETILDLLNKLQSDRERVILLLMVMGSDGYEFKHKDVSAMFGIDYSWYMRIVRGIKQQLLSFSQKKPSKRTKTVENPSNAEQKSQKVEQIA